MFIEAANKKDFKKALSTDIRIVVVNLQKFGSIKSILEEDVLEKLTNIRTAFLIDEIHRSHSKKQHEEMTGLFDELQSVFDRSKTYVQQRKKKNLLVGFTATPSQYTLNRFGEFDIYAESQQIMVPFDSYTMADAIRDGYILNPLTGMVPVAAKMYYEFPEDPAEGTHDDEREFSIRKRKVYENEDRIEAIAKFVVERLVSAVYPNIKKKAKAMLAVYSIDTAIQYHTHIKREFEKIIPTKKKFESYKDAPILIVYSSDGQKHRSASSLNDGKKEKAVLQEFAVEKNGLIIVVDKLQTGFDEPLLHTLFLDKEIKGINAIQTISRVNRKTKGKDDCKIVDFSYKNININNIKTAFEQFSNVVVSDFDPLKKEECLEEYYEELKAHKVFTDNFNDYVLAYQTPKDPNAFLKVENSFSNYIRNHQEGAEALKVKVNKYFNILHSIEFLIELEDKHNEDFFLDFWRRYNYEYNTLRPSGNDKDDVKIYYDFKTGIVAPPTYTAGQSSSTVNEPSSAPYKRKKKGQLDIFELIERYNLKEEEIEALIDDFKKKVEEFFNFLKDPKNGNRLIAKIKDESGAFSEDEIYSDFEILYKKYVRRNRKELSSFFKKESKDILSQLFDDFEMEVK